MEMIGLKYIEPGESAGLGEWLGWRGRRLNQISRESFGFVNYMNGETIPWQREHMMVVMGVGGGQKISSVHTEFEDPVAHPIIAIKTGVWREIGAYWQ